eukprot:UN26066
MQQPEIDFRNDTIGTMFISAEPYMLLKTSGVTLVKDLMNHSSTSVHTLLRRQDMEYNQKLRVGMSEFDTWVRQIHDALTEIKLGFRESTQQDRKEAAYWNQEKISQEFFKRKEAVLREEELGEKQKG